VPFKFVSRENEVEEIKGNKKLVVLIATNVRNVRV